MATSEPDSSPTFRYRLYSPIRCLYFPIVTGAIIALKCPSRNSLRSDCSFQSKPPRRKLTPPSKSDSPSWFPLGHPIGHDRFCKIFLDLWDRTCALYPANEVPSISKLIGCGVKPLPLDVGTRSNFQLQIDANCLALDMPVNRLARSAVIRVSFGRRVVIPVAKLL